MTGRKALPYLLEKDNLIGAEIGVQYADFSTYLLDTGLFTKLYSIDPYPVLIPGVYQYGTQYFCDDADETYKIAKLNLAKYKDSSKLIRNDSVDAAQHFADNYFDFIFIDGDHTFEGVYKDLQAWWPKIKQGAILAGHDYWDISMDCGDEIISTFKVKSAVDLFAEQNELEVLTTKEEGLENWFSWYFIK